MSARLERCNPDRLGLEGLSTGDGHRVFVGSADIRLDDDARVSAGMWCLGPGDELRWWIEGDHVTDRDTLVFNPSRTELLIGSAQMFTRVETATGTILDRGLKTDLQAFGWATDGTLVGMHGERLVRRTLQGQPRPTWAHRSGISGILDDAVEPWLSRSDSVLAVMLDGAAPDLVSAPDRPLRIGNSARTIAGAGGELHLIQAGTVSAGKGNDDQTAVTWLRCDERGAVQHRIVVPVEHATDEAVLDANGRLWVRVLEDERHAILRIDPDADAAQIVASSKQRDRIERFTVDPDGTLRLPTHKKVDTLPHDAKTQPIVRRHRRFRPIALVALLAMAVGNAAAVPAVLSRWTSVREQAAAGMPLRITAGKTGHKMLQPEDLEALAPGLLAYATQLAVMAFGLLLLAVTARTSPTRAANLATAWVIAVAVIALVVDTAVTQRLLGGFHTFTLAGLPAFVHLCTLLALMFLSAFGRQRLR